MSSCFMTPCWLQGVGGGGAGGGQQLSEFLRRHTAEAAATLGQLVRLGPQSGPQVRAHVRACVGGGRGWG